MATGWPFDVPRWFRRRRAPEGVAQPGNPSEARHSPVDGRTVFVSRDLSKIYHMGEVDVVALRSVDLEIREGEFIVLLGPSGSGKSTLLNILGGLDVPTGGEAWFHDHNLVGPSEALLTQYRRDHVGFVFQFYNLIPSQIASERHAGRAESVLGELHGTLGNITLALIVLHVLGVGLMSIVHRENLVAAMITGRKRIE